MADLVNEQLKDELGNNVFPKIKMYQHIVKIGTPSLSDLYYLNIFNTDNTEYNLAKLIETFEQYDMIAHRYNNGLNEKIIFETNGIAIYNPETEEWEQMLYTSLTFEDDVIPL